MKTKGFRLMAFALVLLFAVNLLPVQVMAADETANSSAAIAVAEPIEAPPAVNK